MVSAQDVANLPHLVGLRVAAARLNVEDLPGARVREDVVASADALGEAQVT
jgi:hypothetical protein